MTKTELVLFVELRPEVLNGSKTTASRPGHRPYRLGPATIRFIEQPRMGDPPVWSDVPPVDVVITKVEHARAEGKYREYMRLLYDQGQSPERDKITHVTWTLA